MKKFKNHQCPCRKYRFDIVGHKKALKIWGDSLFNARIMCKSVQPLVTEANRMQNDWTQPMVTKTEGMCDSWIHLLVTQPESMQRTWTQPPVRMVKTA